jgi:hypothetical protein
MGHKNKKGAFYTGGDIVPVALPGSTRGKPLGKENLPLPLQILRKGDLRGLVPLIKKWGGKRGGLLPYISVNHT